MTINPVQMCSRGLQCRLCSVLQPRVKLANLIWITYLSFEIFPLDCFLTLRNTFILRARSSAIIQLEHPSSWFIIFSKVMLVFNIWGENFDAIKSIRVFLLNSRISSLTFLCIHFFFFLRLKWYTTALYNMHVADPFMERVESSSDSAHPVSLRTVSQCL